MVLQYWLHLRTSLVLEQYIIYIGCENSMFGGILAFIDKGPTWERWCEYPKMGGGGVG